MGRLIAVLLVGSMLIALLPFHPVAAQPRAEDAVVQGIVTFDKRYVTVHPIVPGQPLQIVMRFDPQDRQELRYRSGFFILDGDRLRNFFGGGTLIDNNLAAGNPDPNRPGNELVAQIAAPSGEYTVVIYNDSQIPMQFHLSAINGRFPLEASAPAEAAAQPEAVNLPATAASAPAAPVSAAIRGVSGDSIYTVQTGDTLSLIAQALYGDLSLYAQLCSYNSIADCNLIEVGQRLQTPALAVLTGSAAPAPAAAATASLPAAQPVAASAPSSTADSYTVAPGDTLGTIAQKLYGDFQRFREICSLNGLADCNAISVGQVLRLPDGSPASQSQAVAQPAATSAAAPTATASSNAATPALPTPTPVARPVDAPPVAAPQPSGANIVTTLEGTSDKSVFLLLWNTSGLTSILKGTGPLTVFAPSNTAFAPQLQINLNTWMDNKQILERLLSHHVLKPSFDPASLTGGPVDLPTLAGITVRVERTASGGLLVNGAQVIGTPITASNGTIYTIDQVLTPPSE